MRILKGLSLGGIVSVLLLGPAPAKAVTVVVSDNSGGGSVATVTGTATGATVVGNSASVDTQEINGLTGLNIPTSYSITITDGAVVSGIQLITATGTTTVGGMSGSQAVLSFTASGTAFQGFIDLSGTITGVSENNLSGYDFSSMLQGAINLDITKTNTNYENALGHNGVVVASSGFDFQQQQVVPEPASMSLLGIGLASLLAYRRLRKRTSVAS